MLARILICSFLLCGPAKSLLAQNETDRPEIATGHTVITVKSVGIYPETGWMPSSAVIANLDGGDTLTVQS